MAITTNKAAVEYTKGFAHGTLHAKAKTPFTWHPGSTAYNKGVSDGYYTQTVINKYTPR
ncbi:MAG: hypothetical protein ACRCZI_03000 [Cetobacterium sp.]